MVSGAVAELKGEEVREPAEIKLDLPVDANLPRDYVTREDLRLEAYRRLATVTTHAEVDDIPEEWLAPHGALPHAAEAPLPLGPPPPRVPPPRNAAGPAAQAAAPAPRRGRLAR